MPGTTLEAGLSSGVLRGSPRKAGQRVPLLKGKEGKCTKAPDILGMGLSVPVHPADSMWTQDKPSSGALGNPNLLNQKQEQASKQQKQQKSDAEFKIFFKYQKIIENPSTHDISN